MVFSREQEKESNICVRVGQKNLSLMINVCNHSASLVMPISDPQDGISIIMVSYTITPTLQRHSV